MRDKITKETNDQIKAREAKQKRDEKDREEAKALKDLGIFKEKQDKLNKERKEREAKSKAEAEAQRVADFEQKEKDLANNQKKIEIEQRKLRDKLMAEKMQEEEDAREAAKKAKYGKAFRDGESAKAKEIAEKR